ncbi:MAG: hydrogen gas-evolving membrane-bound hydrogenase subunit E [Pseudohongiellaceae bacterium]
MKESVSKKSQGNPVLTGLRLIVLSGLTGCLVYAVMSLPPADRGLSQEVNAQLSSSGVENPVTAVLLNFRAYDTLLEISVLVIALIGVWSLGLMPRRRVGSPGLVLTNLVEILIPFLILFSGYLLWVGSHAPGGAFQAGVILAAAALLFTLSGLPMPAHLAGWPLRLALVIGLGVFISIGVVMMITGGALLEYPPEAAKALILVIEAASTVSIGLILVCVFCGGRPRGPGGAP